MLVLLQVLQAVGAAAGLVSAGYLAWQFFSRRLPVAIIVPRKPYDLSPRHEQFIRIKNPSDRPMIIRFEDNMGQNELRIMVDDSTRASIYAAMGKSMETILDADEAREFRLARRADHGSIDPENQLFVSFHWRYAQPFWWRVERRSNVYVTKRDYDALVADPLRNEDEF